jgi:eukaryotic-like serine/threonine-protein kinase
VTVVDQNLHIGLWDVAGATLRPLTFGSATNFGPLWTPDGRRLVFATFTTTGGLNLFSQPADGAGAADRFTDSPNNQVATGVSPDGTRLVFTEYSPKSGFDVMMLPLGGPHQVVPLVQTPFDERDGIVSPDGRWLAYEANDSGSYEVYVRPFPDVARGHWQISTSGGTQPLWSRSGQELFYFAPDRTVMRVSVAKGSVWTAGTPAQVLEGRYVVSTSSNWLRNYDIAADGQRFLMIKPGGSDATDTPPHMLVIEHFDEELKRLVPTK